MCGLAGILARPGARADRELLLAMAGELRHRGPDGTGLYLDGRVGIVNTRLAVVDPAGGDQPLADEDGRIVVLQNGEVYNHVELRAELEGLGRRFATTCDTEVIAQAYAEWGLDALPRLNGDFAFAVWDRARRELLLVRDRFGVRPLFLADVGGDLTFASEAKALLRHPRLGRALDPSALVDAFSLWSTQPDRAPFAGVRELAPAHYLLVRADGTRVERRWWDLDFRPDERSEAELLDELRELLDDATRLRLRADVTVGAYLSGGLDSTLIAALASRHVRELQAFGIGFDDARYDERAPQQAAARRLGIRLTQTVVGARQIADALPETIRLAERPTLRTAPAPLLRLSSLVREAGLKVVLTGEGADELFGGYDLFREDAVRRFWARDPASTLRPQLLGRLNGYLGVPVAAPFWQRFYARGLTEVDDPFYSHRIRLATGERVLRVLSPGVVGAARPPLEALAARLPARFAEFTPLARAQYLEVATFLQGYLLHSQGDRMLMGNGVEGRFPFLDHRVAELAARLPDRLRLRGLREKYALREAFRDVVPAESLARTKRPYRAPIAAALDAEYVRELLDRGRVARTGLLDADVVGALHAKLRRLRPGGTASETDEMALVGALSVSLLHEQLVERPVLGVPAVPTRIVDCDARPLAGAAR